MASVTVVPQVEEEQDEGRSWIDHCQRKGREGERVDA